MGPVSSVFDIQDLTIKSVINTAAFRDQDICSVDSDRSLCRTVWNSACFKHSPLVRVQISIVELRIDNLLGLVFQVGLFLKPYTELELGHKFL